jgi:hypothetical protein
VSGWQERIPSEGRLARAVRNEQLDRHNARLLARVALEVGGNVALERERVLSRLGDEEQFVVFRRSGVGCRVRFRVRGRGGRERVA